MGFALGAYYAVRLLVRGSELESIRNSIAVLQMESSLHLDWEEALQRFFLDHLPWVIHVLNFVYAWGYWLILALSFAYLYARHRSVYRCLRNALITSGLIGFIVFATFPVAPPRLVPVGIVDTVQLSNSVLEEVARPSSLTNENAAMPSLHFGWILLCGVCLWTALKWKTGKALALCLPALMGLTIVVTGNHYFIDAIAGGAVSLLALVPWVIPRRREQRRPWQLQKA
jgi:membrane-associated phospholipid phosphatase